MVGVLTRRQSAVRSTIFIATARNPSTATPAEPLSSSGLALSYSPLAPDEGTTTFQKPVAIKRIAPALVRDAALVTPFLDTARVVTGLRHTNLVKIREVGQVDSDVFLVMDYLMGETAATLMRRLHSRGERLGFALAAHIIAEASAGLEAGHALGVLHARLTPHDLFIGYDGRVRVLDLGIAAARSRLAGDLGDPELEREYASPEHCKGEELDRRSDVFSLGTMLWELLTGISPFERAKVTDTIRAICEEPIVPPGNVVPGLPAELSTIVVKALARDTNERYATALALREALLGVVPRAESGAAPTKDLSKLMKRLFETRARDKQEMLRRINIGEDIEGLDVAEAEASPPSTNKVSPAKSNPPPTLGHDEPSVIVTTPGGPGTAVAETSSADVSAAPPGTDATGDQAIAGLPSKRRPPIFLVAAVTVLLLGSAAVAIGFRRGANDEAVVKGAPSVAPAPPPSAPREPSTPSAVVSSSAPAPASAAASASAPVTAEETVLHIETVPPRATILVAGVKKGVSPIDLRMPRSGDALVVEIRHAGYRTLKERVVPDVNQRLKLTLVATRDPAAAGSVPYHKFE